MDIRKVRAAAELEGHNPWEAALAVFEEFEDRLSRLEERKDAAGTAADPGADSGEAEPAGEAGDEQPAGEAEPAGEAGDEQPAAVVETRRRRR